MGWEHISTAPKTPDSEFLVWDGISQWVAWVSWGGELVGHDTSTGLKLPDPMFPPLLWCHLPEDPVTELTE